MDNVSDNASEMPADLPWQLLEEITNGFSEEREIGRGGYGVVYKGVHTNGEEIAVKKLYHWLFDDKQFQNELQNLTILRHQNIVRLVGKSYAERERCVEHKGKLVSAIMKDRAICLEYLHNGSLEKHLCDEYSGLSWHCRYKIIKGICDGLKYLHGRGMFHLDLKPANILLDKNMVPKIADFDLSRLFSGTRQSHTTSKSIGTRGYMPPEYINHGKISKKFDVFSLGVIIIGIMTGPNGYSKQSDMSSQDFIEQVLENWRNRPQEQLKDKSYLDVFCQQVKICIEIALNCVETDRHKRPSIEDIISKMNESETMIEKLDKIYKRKAQLEEADLRSKVPRTEMRSFDEGNGLVGMDGPRDELVRRLSGSGDEQENVVDIKKVGSKPAIMTEDAMVSAFTGAMNSLLVKLATLLGEQYAKLTAGTRRKEFMILKDELDAMKTLLEQLAGMAELSAQMRDSRNQMREMTYDIEDCIDDLMVHNVTTLSNDLILMLQNFTDQIYKLKAQLEEADLRSMVPRTEMRSLGPSYMSREQWLSFHEGNGLVGMDGPRDELVRRLNGSGKLQGVCILGVAGIGKTMLATQVYNEIKRRFDRCVFISASKKVDTARLCRSILLQLQETVNSNRRQYLIYRVRTNLQDKRFLIVIDGVWSAQIVEDIKAALPENNRGSRIITTSGISDVAESCGKHFSSFTYPMEPLTFEESLGLFRSIIFGSGRSCPVASEKVDEEIVKACGGIPLALRLIAGALASKPAEMEQWVTFREIKKQAGTDHLNVEWMRKIFDISYSDLSCDMKTCLLYLSAFPENHVIRKDRLIRRWVAEGFLLKRCGKTWWEAGESYFLELVARNLVNPVYDEEDVLPIGCKVSGSVHDFITSLSSEENFVKSDVTDPTCMQHGVFRRLSVDLGSDNQEKPLDLFQGALSSKVRSLTFVEDFGFGWMPYLSAFKHVRVLDLEDNKLLENEQLESIGRLSLLRYLGLGGTSVTKLQQIMALEQLTTLDIRRTRVSILPAFGDTKLVFLLADELIIPRGMGGMQKLEELSKVRMGPDVAGLVNKLRRLRMLGVTFSRWWENQQEVKHFVEEVGKSNLHSLFLDNYPHHLLHLLADSWAHKTPHHLREIKLRISGCLPLVPEEMASLIALTHLHINVEEVEAQGVRALGNLPNLVLLKLVCSYTGVARLAVSSKDGFQCLKVFCYWSGGGGMGLQFEAGAMPQLRRLVLDFKVRETISKYGDFDFGVQHLSYLVLVAASMDCLFATASEVEAAEAKMRDQASQNPNHPVLEWKTRQCSTATQTETTPFISPL